MFPPAQALNLDIEAVSGIAGSISIACWIVVFSPQIIENFRRQSADGLSLLFLVVWLAGDVFNILGAILQDVLPTMIILAVYYTLADVVLLAQCFYYRGFTLADPSPTKPSAPPSANTETTALLSPPLPPRRPSFTDSLAHLSPATPLHPPQPSPLRPSPSPFKPFLLNTFALLLVCLAGVLGWAVSPRSSPHHHHRPSPEPAPPLPFSLWGQVFGYLCAVLYLGSRIPQLLLNHRRKSTDGVSLLFFLFACVGNLTYVLSIVAFLPACARRRADTGVGRADTGVGVAEWGQGCEKGQAASEYARYMAVNASWLLGSLGTLGLDAGIFVQFFLYRDRSEDEGNGGVVVVEDDEEER